MLKSIHLPIALLLAFPTFINSPFSYKEISIRSAINDGPTNIDSANVSVKINIEPAKKEVPDAYSIMKLQNKGLSKEAFDLALKGFEKLNKKRLLRNKNIITVVDFSKPSNEKRLYVIDLKRNKLLHQSLVAHGRNSGFEYATNFSNETDSHKSSLGFYVTMNTYSGEHGYALKLKGCEKGINNKAFDRAIVMHGSEYVTEEFLRSNGYLGRSFGCPALPEKLNKKIIDVIKNGSCLFIYHSTKKYLLNSPLLNG